MVVPLAARWVAAAVGVLLVATSASSVIGTLIVPRSVGSWLTKKVDQLVNAVYIVVTKPVRDFRRRDRILATHAATLLLCQIIAWLAMFFVGFGLIFWPLVHGGITNAFRLAGPGIWEIGSDLAQGGPQEAILDIAALTGLITVTLQIAYLPTLYSAFNRRENEVALLNDRGGFPSLGARAAGAHALRPRLRRLHRQHPARPVRELGTVGRRRRRESHHLPAAGLVPLAEAAVVLGDVAAGRARLGRADALAQPVDGAGGACPALPAGRLHLLRGRRQGDGIRHSARAGPRAGHQRHLRGVPGGHQPAGGSRLPDRAQSPRTPGPTSSAGGSTTRRRPSPSPEPSTRCLRCGLARGGRRTASPSRRSGRRRATRRTASGRSQAACSAEFRLRSRRPRATGPGRGRCRRSQDPRRQDQRPALRWPAAQALTTTGTGSLSAAAPVPARWLAAPPRRTARARGSGQRPRPQARGPESGLRVRAPLRLGRGRRLWLRRQQPSPLSR